MYLNFQSFNGPIHADHLLCAWDYTLKDLTNGGGEMESMRTQYRSDVCQKRDFWEHRVSTNPNPVGTGLAVKNRSSSDGQK